MQNFRATCPDGFTKDVMAASKEEAVKMLMADSDVINHTTTNHPELSSKTPEEMTAMMMGMVKPVM